jgi:hypothetical protein
MCQNLPFSEIVWLKSSLRTFYGRLFDMLNRCRRYTSHTWPLICSICRNHNPILSSFMNYHQISGKSTTSLTFCFFWTLYFSVRLCYCRFAIFLFVEFNLLILLFDFCPVYCDSSMILTFLVDFICFIFVS